VTAQANAIGARAVDLAHTDGRAWEEALVAVRGAETASADDPRRDFALERKLEAAAAAPLEIASLGADVAALAAPRRTSLRRDVPRRRRGGRRTGRGRIGRRRAPSSSESRSPRV
jgi:hypothetical protein